VSSAELQPASAIGFDGSRLTGRDLTGTETYSLELLRQLAPLCDPEELIVYLNASTVAGSLPDGPSYRAIPQQRLWTHVRLARELRSNPPGVLFIPAHVIPIRHLRSVVTIHDLAYRKVASRFSRRERTELEAATRWNCRSAAHIIAVSHRTREDVMKAYGVDANRISVVHHGVSARFQPPTPDAIGELRERHHLNRPFILSVGTLHVRKNLDASIRVFEMLRNRGHDIDLVVCGSSGPARRTLLNQVSQSHSADHIRFLGYVPPDDLPTLYGSAELFMLLSWYEGFGMPALEAMACGTPVIAAGAGALPEVCGPAARLVSPADDEEIVTVVGDVLASDPERARLVELGQGWARQYTWERSARSTLRILRAVRDGTEAVDSSMGWSEAAMTFLARDLEHDK